MTCPGYLTKYEVRIALCKGDSSLNYTLTVTITSKIQRTYSKLTYKMIWLGKRRKEHFEMTVLQIKDEQLCCSEVKIYDVLRGIEGNQMIM